MQIKTEYVDITVADSPLRMYVAAPADEQQYPGILYYSDIFQLTAPMIRACNRLAGYGFVVAAPEIYHRIEPPGTVLSFEGEGRTRALEGPTKTPVAHFDEDCRAVLDYLKQHPRVAENKLGVGGFCIGGHLAFRAAMQPDVQATVCFYGTGIHHGKLGQDADAGSLQRAADIHGELLMVFGTIDPHVPEEGRATIAQALQQTAVKHTTLLYHADHTFMRDEGYRHDAEATDQAFGEMIRLFRRVLC